MFVTLFKTECLQFVVEERGSTENMERQKATVNVAGLFIGGVFCLFLGFFNLLFTEGD